MLNFNVVCGYPAPVFTASYFCTELGEKNVRFYDFMLSKSGFKSRSLLAISFLEIVPCFHESLDFTTSDAVCSQRFQYKVKVECMSVATNHVLLWQNEAVS